MHPLIPFGAVHLTNVLIDEPGPTKLTWNSVLLPPGVKWTSMPVTLGGNRTLSFGYTSPGARPGSLGLPEKRVFASGGTLACPGSAPVNE